MLQAIRDGSKGWVTWFIVGLVSLTFVVIGTGNYLSDQGMNEVVTKVEGVKITKALVEKRAKRILNQTKAEDLVKLDSKTLKDMALKEVINETILVNAALKRGFVVSEEQVINLLYTLPNLQEKGEFSLEKYRSVLSQLEYTDAEFRQEIQNVLLIEQLRQAFRQTAFTSPEVLTRTLQFENQKRDFDFVFIPNSLFKKEVNVFEPDLKAYYKQHPEQFMTNQKIKVEYLELIRSEQDSDEIFSKKADDLIQLSYDHNESLILASDKLSLPIKSFPDWVEENGSHNFDLFNHPKVKSALFSEEILGRMNSEVIQIDENRYIVFRMSDHKKPFQKEFSLVKSEIEAKLMAELTAKKAQALSAQWVEAIKKGKNWKSDLSKAYPLKWESVYNATRGMANLPLQLIESVFSLPKPIKNEIFAKALTLTEDYQAIIVLKSVSESSSLDQDLDQKKRLESELAYYSAQLEFDLFAKAALKAAP